ncbi:GNAT family N-acetyltransferase [Sulfuriflexus mobilis]|uniref:GNAT family N-acetyltransferase n=1 Tax=Sulfuriflexus mobilis TaxID=1811807 RepID=UPI000F81C800|nr:GNAT family N-acetyltransferase [Sulfuriflexus mobilis]
MQALVHSSLSAIDASDWNALVGETNPFLRYEFLHALEAHDCLRLWGWLPQYLCVFEGEQLVGAAPMYLKDNSYGEFVFDWAWAEAYARHGLQYYPKLVVAVPYTPVTGQRLLVNANHPQADLIRHALHEGALSHAKQLEVSSLHWLFTNEADTDFLEQQGLMRRTGCQFHWHNAGYQRFDDYLAVLTSKKRKQVRRERRLVDEAGIEVELLHGRDTTEAHWETFYEFYCSTFARKSGHPTLSKAFFIALSQDMPDAVVLVLAKHEGRYVAGTFNLRGSNALFGRHWGCHESFSGLHFELCYYRLIDYCIEHGLARFEAGAQGEHKISRGFLPQATWSAHWLAHPDFSDAVSNFLKHEHGGMQDYMQVLNEHSPYKTNK